MDTEEKKSGEQKQTFNTDNTFETADYKVKKIDQKQSKTVINLLSKESLKAQ